MLIGLLSFLASGIITGFLSLKTNEVLMLVLGIPAGSLLMLWLLRRLPGDKILAVIIRSFSGGSALWAQRGPSFFRRMCDRFDGAWGAVMYTH